MRLRLLTVVVLTAVVSSAQAEPLTLEQAIQLALTRNERSAVTDLEVVIAEADVTGARANFLPVVDLSAAANYRPLADENRSSAQTTLSVSQPIFNPSAFPLRDQAKHQLEAQRNLRVDARRRLAFETANAFMAVLLADQVVQAAQRKLETAATNLATTDAQVKAQLVSANDVTRAQISLSTATRDLASARGNLKSAYVALAFLTNAKVDSVSPPTALLVDGQKVLGDEAGLVSTSITRRADLLANKQLAVAARDFAREARARYLPAFELGGSLTGQADNGGSELSALVGISARWTLWDSGARRADVRSRDARAKIADLETQALVREIEADVRSAAVLLSSRQEALAAATMARDAARKGADEASILYRQGLAKAIELVDANDQRFIAEVNHATSEFDVARAYLSLRLAMGFDPTEVKR